ncbi:prolipoprotein diacylglyceryl transferase [Salibaculum griseiflavum]|uniref:Phosphatidylglycerol--prolipoprotein diacylglyceryl transferase n=1 Tax=Salibaculum griseiflavum TaxID=1914409 RepID=A0A2V1P5K2_9RHOB|nr:prolipoprotein diacylglyceryl transferase [Salibaculum griseiflavum]PWG17745.1 prolipoprotein diacylglyceryl transferase [Salibaculum griseiflavum]
MIAAIPFPDIRPEIFTIELFGTAFALRWYAMAYIVGILLGWRLAVAAVNRPRLWADEKTPMTKAQVEDLLTAIILGVILGGRLGYVLFYRPGYYLQNPLEIPMLWQGGMAFHGGFLGVVVAVWLVARKHDLRLGDIANLVALSATPAIFLVRIANFINAELWGRPTDLPWGVIFPGTAAQDCAGVDGLCARHPSQLYEAGLEGLLLGLLLVWLAFGRGWLKRRWSLAGLFFAGYGTARFLVEFVRQPDAQFVTPGNPVGLAFHVDGVGLTMGQALSLPMIVVGLAVMVWANRPPRAAA